ncbi:MAG: hypothetical protein ACI8Y4_005405, partial [Candidatus Poriferisodalaceae bacterium]
RIGTMALIDRSPPRARYLSWCWLLDLTAETYEGGG